MQILHIGLIGDPVAHSYSPRLQQPALDALGIPARYELWQTPASELPARITSLRHPQYLGANVTIPHKEAVLALLDNVDPLAARIGAVNTIVHRNGLLLGYNTDAPGLLQALAEQGIGKQDHTARISLQDYTVILLGAGGAARGAAFALSSASLTRLIIVNRHLDRAQRLAADLQQHIDCHVLSLDDLHLLTPNANSLILNATSQVMNEDARLLPPEILARYPPNTLVFDMIYNPKETKLLRQARTLGLRAINGLPMLLHQGALSFTLWTNQPAPLEIMRQALLSA
jgi:shikimate dehydrogenase